MKIITLLLTLLLASWDAAAGNPRYSIQVAATESVNLAPYRDIIQFGSLYTEPAGNGLVRIKVGAYETRAEAEQALIAIQAKGFSQAFITATPDNPATNQPLTATLTPDPRKQPTLVPVRPHTQTAPDHTPNAPLVDESKPVWSRLSEAERRRVIYLDGILHMRMQGSNELIPLSDYHPGRHE